MLKYYSIFFSFFCCLYAIDAQTFFSNVAEEVGINIPVESTLNGNGISFVDFNMDGWDDISICTGPNDRPRFYLNIDGEFFVEVSLNLSLENFQNKQINWVDYDNDGDRDLFVTSNTDGNRLFSNTGNLVFEDVTETSGFLIRNTKTNGASWGDVNNDGCLDVYLSNHTGVNSGDSNLFYINNCDGTFTEVTDQWGLTNSLAPTFCSAFIDINNDGWLDLFIANDRSQFQNFLFKNTGEGSFIDISESSNMNVVMDAMSATADDFNSDGFVDIYVTNTPDNDFTPFRGNGLFLNNGDETFTNISEAAGTMFGGLAWGACFLDIENDGDLDLYVSSSFDGTFQDYPSYAMYENIGNNQFFQNIDMGFVEDSNVSYANAIGDLNNDGLMDIVVLNNDDAVPFIWKNETASPGNYLKIELEGNESNREGIGSVIEISVNGNIQYRHVLCGEGYLAQNSFIEHFGVDNATTIDYVKVKWLSGIEDVVTNVNVNQKLKIIEGSRLSTSSIDEQAIQIYPTAFDNLVNINVPNHEFQIKLYNSLGQFVCEFVDLSSEAQLDLTYLSKGVYFIIVETPNYKVFKRKLVKF